MRVDAGTHPDWRPPTPPYFSRAEATSGRGVFVDEASAARGATVARSVLWSGTARGTVFDRSVEHSAELGLDWIGPRAARGVTAVVEKACCEQTHSHFVRRFIFILYIKIR